MTQKCNVFRFQAEKIESVVEPEFHVPYGTDPGCMRKRHQVLFGNDESLSANIFFCLLGQLEGKSCLAAGIAAFIRPKYYFDLANVPLLRLISGKSSTSDRPLARRQDSATS